MTGLAGNALYPSRAANDGRPINNLPGLYPTEDWVVHYWDVEPRGHLHSRQAVIQLPDGYAQACAKVTIGEPGCVRGARRWGVQCCTHILEEIGFDPRVYVTRDPDQVRCGEDGAIVLLVLSATHFDLPASFVIASQEHPLLLFDPRGELKGSCTRWYTHLGALAHMVSDGTVSTSFGGLRAEDSELYHRALTLLEDCLRGMDN